MNARAARRRRGFHRSADAQRGYTLIEVIVAFALLAFAMTLLLGSLTNATKQVRGAADAGRAALHAQSLLDQIGVGEGLAPGRRDGELEDGRYRWELEVKPFVDPTAPPRVGEVIGAPQLMQLQLTLLWGEGGPRQRLRLEALRLVTPTDLNAGARSGL
ncbi:MAG: type II secretion system protein [Lysobacter sp.]|nr:MAG: type II secretion system protein [Lysobacter sp.]